jgi:hypothetical protein
MRATHAARACHQCPVRPRVGADQAAGGADHTPIQIEERIIIGKPSRVKLAGNQAATHALLLSKGRAPMKEKTVMDHEGRKHPADTAQPGGAAYAPHNQDAEKLAEGIGDDRTPDKTIGEIKYAKKPEKNQDKDRPAARASRRPRRLDDRR